MEQKIKNIKQKIIDCVDTGTVSMKPKWFFVLKSILRISAIFLVFLTIIYFISFIGLIIQEKALFDLFDLGPRGMKEFLFAIPWFIVLISLFLLFLLEVLASKFSFVYEKPIFYSLLLLMFCVLLICFVLYKIDKQFSFARFGERPNAPVFGPMHKYYRGEFEKRPFYKELKRQNKRDLMFLKGSQ